MRGSCVVRVERDPGQAAGFHGGADLAFEECFGEHGEEVACQQCFDAVRGFEVDRCDCRGVTSGTSPRC